jgi:hypothetical protein
MKYFDPPAKCRLVKLVTKKKVEVMGVTHPASTGGT